MYTSSSSAAFTFSSPSLPTTRTTSAPTPYRYHLHSFERFYSRKPPDRIHTNDAAISAFTRPFPLLPTTTSASFRQENESDTLQTK